VSQFAFLRREWADVYDAAGRSELLVYRDTRASCFYARRALAVSWAFKYDPALKLR
jgi:type I restriction enzyme R subunit